MATRAKVAEPKVMVIAPINRKRAIIRITGDSRLVTNQFSAKAKQAMLDKMRGIVVARGKRPIRVPEEDYEASKYLDDDGRCCVRSVSIKCAMLDSAVEIPGTSRAHLQRMFHVIGDLLPIEGEPKMREDTVTIRDSMGKTSTDLRYRAEFFPWSIDVPIVYDQDGVTLDQLVNLVGRAGFSAGIGEYRVQRRGNWGMFSVSGIEG